MWTRNPTYVNECCSIPRCRGMKYISDNFLCFWMISREVTIKQTCSFPFYNGSLRLPPLPDSFQFFINTFVHMQVPCFHHFFRSIPFIQLRFSPPLFNFSLGSHYKTLCRHLPFVILLIYANHTNCFLSISFIMSLSTPCLFRYLYFVLFLSPPLCSCQHACLSDIYISLSFGLSHCVLINTHASSNIIFRFLSVPSSMSLSMCMPLPMSIYRFLPNRNSPKLRRQMPASVDNSFLLSTLLISHISVPYDSTLFTVTDFYIVFLSF